ncbi:MAG: hypothetical protein DRN05_02380 [Thermoplasmata archaeon]|nr:MAG: hypothetical protein DRN05_02380 [Thermoplasmata archaeon]
METKPEKNKDTETPSNPEEKTLTREELEQRRNILQNLKDFDFKIKKNQEDINILKEKIDSLSKDLDDLVSLYEIVSEQMNPFVGLSKVTKKRIEALENFTKEVEELKTRINDLELTLEKNGIAINNTIDNIEKQIPTSTYENNKNIIIEKTTSNENIDLTNEDINKIIDTSLETLLIDQKIDNIIEEFIEEIKK